MDVTIHIPDDLAAGLGTAGNLPRRVLEALAVEEFGSFYFAFALHRFRRVIFGG
jgi:hypothetical protein